MATRKVLKLKNNDLIRKECDTPMLKVLFMNPNGDNLDSRDMSLEQLQALKFADKVDL